MKTQYFLCVRSALNSLFVHAGEGDAHDETDAPAFAIDNAQDHGIAALSLKVLRPLRQDLPGARVNVEVIRIGAPQAVSECIAVGIARRDGIPYRLIRRCVLSHGARHGWGQGERRYTVDRIAEALKASRKTAAAKNWSVNVMYHPA